jgi:hypothetical protein
MLPDVQDGLLVSLQQEYAAAVRGHARVLSDLSRARPVLDATGVRWAVIKGPAAVELLYGAAGRRSYRDLDLLIDPAGYAEVLEALQQHGSELLAHNWKKVRLQMPGQLHLKLPGGTPLDLHWNLIDRRGGRMRIDSQEVLSRLKPVDLGGFVVPTPDPTDSVVHLAALAALAGGDRWLWIKDIERSIAVRPPPSWDVLVERATRWGVNAPVGLMLSRAGAALGAPLPQEVPRALLGRGLETFVRAVDGLWPPGRASRRRTPARLLAGSISHGLVGGSVMLIERSVAHLDRRGLEPGAGFYSEGGDRDREAFLQAVRQAGGLVSRSRASDL